MSLKPFGAGLFLGLSLLASSVAMSQPTVGLFVNETPQEGLTLFGPNGATDVYLINNDGLVVNTWRSGFRPAMMGYLLENGNLLRSARLPDVDPNFAGAAGGRIEEYDWDGNLSWGFDYSRDTYLSHHDIEPLPNGNVLLIAWEYVTESEAVEAGKNPALINRSQWVDHIVEIRPIPPSAGEIVWRWFARDHLIQDFDPLKANFGVVEDHPELIDFNAGGTGQDWTHFNGIDYNPELDQIVVSSRTFSEIWVIDHSTTTEEAAGHSGGLYGKGGDLLYRWGNPQAYRRGSPADQRLFLQHDAEWIPAGYPGAGNILIFNNGGTRPEGEYSSVDEIVPPMDQDGNYLVEPGEAFGPESPVWSFVADPPEDLFSSNSSGAQRQPNGNTLICEASSGRFREVEPDGELAWDYINAHGRLGIANQGEQPSDNAVFKVRRYPLDYPGFAGHDLTPGDPVEGLTPPFPVPADSLIVNRASLDGSIIDVEWDAFSCQSFGYNLIYGELQAVSAYAVIGAECGLGVTGGFLWTDVPDSDLFVIVVGTDDTGVYESSWGDDAGGAERFATKASFRCGTTTKIVTSTCP